MIYRVFQIVLFVVLLITIVRLANLGFFGGNDVIVVNVLSKPVPQNTIESAIRKALGSRHVSDHIDLRKNSIRFNWAPQNRMIHAPPVAIVVVCTTPVQKYRRSVIRQTWATWCEQYGVKFVFYVGIPKDGELRSLALESLLHDDIIVDEFEEGTYSASVKALRMFRWFLDFYGGSEGSMPQFFIKADDDVFLHIPNIVKHLLSLKNPPVRDYLAGSLHLKAAVTRKNTSSFYVPVDLWPRRHYPPYLSGSCYILSSDLVFKIFWTSFNVLLFHLEDVYITGIVANETLRVKLHGFAPDIMVERTRTLSKVLQFRNNLWKAVAYHGVNGSFMKYLYRTANLHV